MSAYTSGTRLYDAGQGVELCRLRHFGDGDVWLLWQRNGQWVRARNATTADLAFFNALDPLTVLEVAADLED